MRSLIKSFFIALAIGLIIPVVGFANPAFAEEVIITADTIELTDGNTYVLNSTVYLNGTLKVNADSKVKIDLKGHTLNGPTSGYTINNEGELEIVSTEGETKGQIVGSSSNSGSSCVRNAATLRMEGVIVDSHFVAVKNEDTGNLTIVDSELTSTYEPIKNEGTGTLLNWGTAEVTNTIITAKNATGKGTLAAVFATSGDKTNGNDPQDSKTILNNCEMTGDCSIYGKKYSGEDIDKTKIQYITVNGGVFNSKITATTSSKSEIDISGNVTVNSKAISTVLSKCEKDTTVILSENLVNPSLTIPEGVTLKGADNGVKITLSSSSAKVVLLGTLGDNITVDAPVFVENMANNGAYYGTVKKAQEAIGGTSDKPNEKYVGTIKLLKDLDSSKAALKADSNYNITLDLNGNKLTQSSPVNVSGALTIVDNGDPKGSLKADVSANNSGSLTLDSVTVEGTVTSKSSNLTQITNSSVKEVKTDETTPSPIVILNSTVDSKLISSKSNIVATVGDMSYTTLQPAIDAAEETGGTVTLTLTSNVEITTGLTIDKPISIDANGYTITAVDCPAITINADISALTVNDLKLVGETKNDNYVAGEIMTAPYMGIGTYNQAYGVNNLQLNNVSISGFDYGMYFGNKTGNMASLSITANNLTLQDNYIKGAYFEKLTNSSFNNCKIIDNGNNESEVTTSSSSYRTWMCGIDVNLKYGSYQNIRFNNCEFNGNGQNNGTALHIKARDDGNYASNSATLNGIVVSGCDFSENNSTNMENENFGPIVIGEPDKNNMTPVNVQIQSDVKYTSNLDVTQVCVVTYDSRGGSEVPVSMVKAGSTIVLPTPYRSGYNFGGWYNEDGAKVTSPYIVSSSVTLTARWDLPYTGSYNYNVAIDNPTNGTIAIPNKDQWAVNGEEITITVTPDKGYVLDKLTIKDANGKTIEVTDNGDGTFTFTMPSSSVSVEAKFVEDTTSEEPSDEPNEPDTPADVAETFTDVEAGAWYEDAVQFCFDNGIMTGTSDTTFEPNTTTTRGMIVSMLHRMENSPAVSGGSFSDVAGNEWYADPVAWASANGIVGGYEDGTFQPNKTITREELASILYRYAEYKGIDTNTRADLSRYTDSPSAWAMDVMQWANAEGLIGGRTATTIDAQGVTTRAECAAIFQRFIENVAP